MKAIVLDGYHAGTVVDIPPLDVLRLSKPSRIVWCDCDPGMDATETDYEESIQEYRLAAMDYKRDCGLFSVKGDLFDPMTKGRDWVMKDRGAGPTKLPIFIHCRDERAWR